MTPERLEEIREENARMLASASAWEMRVGTRGQREAELIAEIDRLRAPVGDVEVAGLVEELTSRYDAPGHELKNEAGPRAVDLIAQLVRERDAATKLAELLNKMLGEAEAETERLRKGGCARDQKTTQWCAEAVQAIERAEIAEAEEKRWHSEAMEARKENRALREALEWEVRERGCDVARKALEAKP